MTTRHRPPVAVEGFPPRFPDDLGTDAPLGCVASGGTTLFRIFAPRATSVRLEIFGRFSDECGEAVEMTPAGGGTWEHSVRGDLTGRWYGYRIDGPPEPWGMFDPSVLVADPYSKAVTTINNWRLPAKTLIADTSYDWGGDRSPLPRDQAEMVIYECHVRDMTAHPSSGARRPGTYAGFAEEGIAGGLGHILSLGVNAVELLPVMKFGTMEIPFRDPSARTDQGRVNDWNPYARNHWGYMTSFFFAPETYYATDGTAAPGAVNGADGRAARELKNLVKACHARGISVILDVVYNHTSHYDFNPFKRIDRQYYYRCDAEGKFLEASGCGNDFATERPMARRVILDSVRHWLEEYRVDGFRFDLAGMIDEETCRRITSVARAVRPGVALIAEPWGGGAHHPRWFSELGWWSWSDLFRDAVKGRDPLHSRGFIFGDGTRAAETAEALGATPPEGGGGSAPEHRPLNYLEAHDGYTLGDFIRIATGEVAPDGKVAVPTGPDTGAAGTPARAAGVGRLPARGLALNRFAALVLMSSPGPVMVHEGQEFARAKVIAPGGVPDPDAGKLDHNSYNKDNATNHLDFGLRDVNAGLFEYYRALIGMRRRHPLLGSPLAARTVEFPSGEGVPVIVRVGPGKTPRARGGFNRYIVLLNPSPGAPAEALLPEGTWFALADATGVHPAGMEPEIGGTVRVPPSSGVIAGGRN
jgi:pullulanase/glycogen debranching enzyme